MRREGARERNEGQQRGERDGQTDTHSRAPAQGLTEAPPFPGGLLTAVLAGLRGTSLALRKVWVPKPEAGGGQL